MTVAAQARPRAVRIWLLTVAALMFATLLVGGATRLTGSGLSIVEWRPVTGIVPPLDEAGWQAEFARYRSIPQYREFNRGMSLAEFKAIYWWEWTHRLLARVVGLAFLLPFLWLLWRRRIDPALRLRLWTIFGFGAALGAVGWWMVASGLTERVNVSQYRLAVHLTLACLIYAAILWTAQQLRPREPLAAPPRIRIGAMVLLVLLLLQVYLGALVAGLRAGLLYTTWPLIDGAIVPDASRLFLLDPPWRNLFENPLTVQFSHRMVGYALVVGALLHAADIARRKEQRAALGGALTLAAAFVVQALLGVLTLIHAVPLALALSHQAMAMLALTVATVHAQRLEWVRSAHARRGAPVPSAPAA